MKSVFACLGLAVALVASTAQHANAAPITYEIKGTGSGKIGATTFTNALVVFTGTADTSNVGTIFGGLFYATLLDSLTVNIAGVGTAALTEPAAFYSIPFAVPDDIDTDNELPNFPFVLLGRLDQAPPDLEGFTGIAATASNALAGYDLKTAIGPIVGGGGVGFIEHCSEPGHDPCLATTKGLLSFTTNISDTAQGTFTATMRVPEPSALILMSTGVVAFVRRRRR